MQNGNVLMWKTHTYSYLIKSTFLHIQPGIIYYVQNNFWHFSKISDRRKSTKFKKIESTHFKPKIVSSEYLYENVSLKDKNFLGCR